MAATMGKRSRARRFQAFGVGPGKTGTHSLAAVFRDHYRSAHEPGAEQLIPLLIAHDRGEMPDAAFIAYMHQADEYLPLEMNASSLNTFCVDLLAREFLSSKFILLARDCISWANSALNQFERERTRYLTETPPEHWRQWFEWTFGDPRAHVYAPEEQVLRERGHPPLATLFDVWARHYRVVLENVPPARLLLVQTRQLSQRLPDIAAFLGIDPATLNANASNQFRAPENYALLETVPAAFVQAVAEAHCRDLMRVLFPTSVASSSATAHS
jgi:hypothetical protein